MAGKGKGREPGFYVYAIMDGETVLYVGKGHGRRARVSARNHCGQHRILERMECENEAFAREVFWIAELMPQNNITKGGNGGRVKPKGKKRQPKAYYEMERVGRQVYCARFLCERLAEHNCELYGVSKVDLNRLREVAYG